MPRGCCGWGLHWLPISVVTIMPLTFMTTFAIAVCLGHIEPDFPYISDTGAMPPESCIFGQCLNIAAVLIGLTFYVRYKQIEEHYRQDLGAGYTKLNRFSLVLGLLSALGISIVGNFQETHVLTVHLFGAVMAFGLGVVYCWMQTYLSFKLHPRLNTRCMSYTRLAVCIISAIAFVCTFTLDGYARHIYHGHDKRKWLPSDGGFTYHIISTTSEWVMAVTFLLFFMTFIPEFYRLELAPVQFTFVIQEPDADVSSGIYRTEEEIIT